MKDNFIIGIIFKCVYYKTVTVEDNMILISAVL
jgi:hypothetical protein